MKPSGLWQPSSAQPRDTSLGSTLASKNCRPIDFVSAGSGCACTSSAQAFQASQVSSERDWKNTPPVWLMPPPGTPSGRSRISLCSTDGQVAFIVASHFMGGDPRSQGTTNPAACT